MTYLERGTKRICQSCTAKYYDLNHDPIVCPKCQVEFDPAAGLKLRRDTSFRPQPGRAKSVFGKSTPLGIVEADPDVAPEEPEALEEEEDKIAVEDDEDPIEDISELGDDEDDVAEVIDSAVDDDRERVDRGI